MGEISETLFIRACSNKINSTVSETLSNRSNQESGSREREKEMENESRQRQIPWR